MLESILYQNHSFRLVSDQDIPRVRLLVNAAYKELADKGLNYTATYQDEEITRERISQGRAFVLEKDDQLIGTVLLLKKNLFTGSTAPTSVNLP